MLGASGVRALQQRAAALGLHDLPAGPQGFEAGDPLCSVEAEGDSADDVLRALADRRAALDGFLETFT